MLWFNFILGINLIFHCFKLIIIHYQCPKTKENKIKAKLNHNISMADIASEQALRGALAAGGKRKESLQLCLWNLNSPSNSPAAPHRPSCQISANQRKALTSANVSKHWKIPGKGDNVITYVISANQHFASLLQAPLAVSRPAARAPQAGYSWHGQYVYYF